jgi:uncharacterized protein YndB with AHSA1/START domain
MVQRTVTHATFAIERTYNATPATVFAAWSDPVAKRRWFVGPADWEDSGYSLDFRVSGREHSSGGPRGGPIHHYDATYLDIVPNERIIYGYDMHLDDKRISVSLATVEFKPAGKGTRLTFTEQGAFLDGYDDAGSRERGTTYLLDALGAGLARETANA